MGDDDDAARDVNEMGDVGLQSPGDDGAMPWSKGTLMCSCNACGSRVTGMAAVFIAVPWCIAHHIHCFPTHTYIHWTCTESVRSSRCLLQAFHLSRPFVCLYSCG
jgi:hypothetical protein